MELEMIDVFCRCGLAFRVNKGNPQKWHAKSCQDFYNDKDVADYRRVWRRTNGATITPPAKGKKFLKRKIS